MRATQLHLQPAGRPASEIGLKSQDPGTESRTSVPFKKEVPPTRYAIATEGPQKDRLTFEQTRRPDLDLAPVIDIVKKDRLSPSRHGETMVADLTSHIDRPMRTHERSLVVQSFAELDHRILSDNQTGPGFIRHRSIEFQLSPRNRKAKRFQFTPPGRLFKSVDLPGGS
ncbi:MAG: hypothetical protein AAF514_11960 [Verrucomicrobiota bacterium]